MVFTDTKLYTEIIKELFWNFHWGHYVSVSHLDYVNGHPKTPYLNFMRQGELELRTSLY